MRSGLVALFAFAPFAWALGCPSDPPPLELCGAIPDGGCPVGRGGTCDDPSCVALYDCVHAKWTKTTTCAPRDAGPDARDGGDAGDACAPIHLSHDGETTGCTPDLQEPDCPVVAAETCAREACATGCLDFYLCSSKCTGGACWVSVAYCDENGELVIKM